ncbi:hypothetical protein LV89_04571 [Arcicella aurantiaca]|uniref:Uncharacterized protein n=1 Tax=Arcicella aurantiaca TaxID=591202 RepID=A0A316DFG6_9BACT|nr:hypothetical protein [Arcicella aurantiaca]PWK17017.1 hypothetical protein LV89_04571 [Arcicella aurantiaca]
MYIIYLIIVVLAFVINIYLLTKNPKADGGQSGVAPVVQMVIGLPMFLGSSLIFFLLHNTEVAKDFPAIFIPLPLILEIVYFTFTKDIFKIHSPDFDGKLIRSYVVSTALATVIGYVLHSIF